MPVDSSQVPIITVRGLHDSLAPQRRALRRAQLRLGVADGALGGSVLAMLIWLPLAWFQPTTLPAGMVAALTLGIVGGLLRAQRRRLSDGELVQFLDQRWNTGAMLTSALLPARESPLTPTIRKRAGELLAHQTSDRLRASRRRHLLLIPALVALVVLPTLGPTRGAMPQLGETTPDDPTTSRKRSALAALKRVHTTLLSPQAATDQEEELRVLRDKVAQLLKRPGSEQELLAKLLQLHREVSRQLLGFEDPEHARGLQAAADAMGAFEHTRAAARSLQEGDLLSFEEQMDELSNSTDAAARESARQALEQARAAVGQRNPEAVETLREQQELLGTRAAARTRRGPETSGRPSPERSAPVAIASESLSEQEERTGTAPLPKQLDDASAVPKSARRGETQVTTDPAFSDADRPEPNQNSRDLDGEATKRLPGQALQALAARSAYAEHQQRLKTIERGLERAIDRLRRPPLMAAETPRLENGSEAPGRQRGGTPGAGRRGAAGDHSPQSNADASLRDAQNASSRVRPDFLTGSGLGPAGTGRTAASTRERARLPLAENLAQLRVLELQGVERREVPREYQEQVSRYFSTQ